MSIPKYFRCSLPVLHSLILLLLLTSSAAAVPKTWNNANNTGLWSDPGDWLGGVLPSAGDVAIFDNTSSAGCVINTNPGSVTIQITSGYGGTITQGVAVSASALTQAGGTWVQGAYPLMLSGNLTFSGGVFQGEGNSITAVGYAQSGGVFTSTSGVLSLTDTFGITGGSFVHHSGTIYLVNNYKSVNSGGQTLNHLTFSGYGFLTSSLTLDGNLTSGERIYGLGHDLALRGNLTTTYIENPGAVTFNGSGAQTLNLTGILGSGNMLVNKPSGTLSVVNQDPGLLSGRGLSLVGGTLDLGGRTVTVSGDFMNSGGTLNLHDGTLAVEGNFSNTGTANLGSGTVNLNGGSQSILGTSIFDQLSKTAASAGTLTFPAGLTQTVTGMLVLQGAYGNLLSLRSSSTGTPWLVDPRGSRVLRYLDVKDSNNLNATVATVENGTNSGNNTNWAFVITGVWSNAGGDHLWSNPANWFGNAVPVVDAVFNSTSSAGCTIDVDPGSIGIRIESGYAGTITQGATVSAASLTQASGTYTQGGYPLTLSGNLSVSGGSFIGGSNSITAVKYIQGGGAVTSTSGILSLTNSVNEDTTFGITGGSFNHNFGTIHIINNYEHVKSNGQTLNHVAFDGIGRLRTPTTLVGNLTSPSNVYADDPLTLQGNINVSTLYANMNLTFSGSGAQTLSIYDLSSYNTVFINKSGGALTIIDRNCTSTMGNVTLQSGILDLGGRTLSLNMGNFTNTGGTLILHGGTLGVGGTFNNAGTASLGSGTVSLIGENQSILGTSIFNNLSKIDNGNADSKTLTFPAGLMQTVTGTLTLQGANGNLLSLRSSVAGTPWGIDPQGDRTVQYLDVKDSNNINSVYIAAYGKGCADSGNNMHWLFVAPLQSPTRTVTYTVTPTPTVTATPSITPTATPTDTLTTTSTPTDTPTVTLTFTATSTSTLTRTVSPTATTTPTSTVSPTPSPSLTVTPTPFRSVTLTVSPTTSKTPVYASSNLGKSVLAPVPVRVGGILHLYFEKAPASSSCQIYNFSGEKVIGVDFGDLARPGIETATLAPGIYLARIKLTFQDGSSQTIMQKIAITR